MQDDDLTASVLARLIREVKARTGHEARILEIGAHEGAGTASHIRTLVEREGVKPEEFVYYCQDLEHVPSQAADLLGRMKGFDLARLKILSRSDASTVEGLEALAEHGPFDIVITKNVKTLFPVDRGTVSDPSRVGAAERTLQRIHDNTHDLLSDNGVMVDVMSRVESSDYREPRKAMWAAEKPVEHKDYVAKVYRKRPV